MPEAPLTVDADRARRRWLRHAVALLAAPWASLAAAATRPGAHAQRPKPAPAASASDTGSAPTNDKGLPLALPGPMPANLDPAPYLIAEKLDGVRAYWDGTVLRFRSGRTIKAPTWFLARLPLTTLDGELWAGRGRFELLSGAVRRVKPDDDEWHQISYRVFELPEGQGSFEQRYAQLRTVVKDAAWSQLQAVDQARVADRDALQRRLDDVIRQGGEGLVLHRADAPYLTGRTDALYKLKPIEDADAVVVAQIMGKGRNRGQLGALEVKTPEGLRFRIGTGFSDAQRRRPPAIGTTITYTYRDLTATGVPRFASFLRVRDLP